MPRKGFYITDEDVLNRLKEVDNESEYVQMLILMDIYGDDNFNRLKKEVYDLIVELNEKLKLLDMITK